MTFGPCPVVRIVANNSDGFTEINESDFDPAVHKLFGGSPIKTGDSPAETDEFTDMTREDMRAYLGALGVSPRGNIPDDKLRTLCRKGVEA